MNRIRAKKRPKVVIITYAFGAPNCLASTSFCTALAHGFEYNNYDCEIVVLSDEYFVTDASLNVTVCEFHSGLPNFRQWFMANRFDIPTPSDLSNSWPAVAKLVAHLRQSFHARFDRTVMVYPRDPHLLEICTVACAVLDARLVVISTEEPVELTAVPGQVERYVRSAVENASTIWTVSRYLEKFWLSRGAESSRVFVNPSINPEKYFSEVETPIKYHAAFAGNLGPRYINHIITIATLVCAKVPDFRLAIYADSTSAVISQLKNNVGLLGMSDNILIKEPVSPHLLSRELRQALTLWCPWGSERTEAMGVPHKIGDYFAAGRLIIASAAGDISEYFISERDGLFVAPADDIAFAEKVIWAISNNEQAILIADKGRITGHKIFGSNDVIESFIEFMESNSRFNIPIAHRQYLDNWGVVRIIYMLQKSLSTTITLVKQIVVKVLRTFKLYPPP